jgi:hypothetical protein
MEYPIDVINICPYCNEVIQVDDQTATFDVDNFNKFHYTCLEKSLLQRDQEEYYEDDGFFNSKFGLCMVFLLIFLFSLLILLIAKLCVS